MRMAEVFGSHEFLISLPEGSSVSDIISFLEYKYGNAFSDFIREPDRKDVNGLHWKVQYILNGRNVGFLNGRDTVCRDGDELFLLLPVSGG